jgi:pilus assembly protein CpaC
MHLLLQKRISVLLILISNMVWNNNTYAEVVGTNQVDKSNKENRKNEINKKLIPAFSCSKEFLQSENISLGLGKSVVLPLSEPIVNRTLGNPGVVHAMLVSSNTMYLVGLDIGTTNMIMQGKSGQCKTLEITVGIDPSALQEKYKELMPEEKEIKVIAAADSLVLSGTVTDSIAVVKAVDIANAFVRRPLVMNSIAIRDGVVGPSGMPSMSNAGGNTILQQQRVINLLGVGAAQQVMLEVKIAEVSKTLLDKLGVGVAGSPSNGSYTWGVVSNFLSGTLGGNVSVTRSTGANVTLEAEKKDGLVKILAEPTVMAISGQEGSFLAGGKILIPIAQDSLLGTNRVTLEEKEFGVGLKFTPTVLSGGRINLKVAPEVSEISREGIGISTSGGTSRAILPLITTRRASTTVQLMDGQSFAIGGLIKNNTTANIKAFPILGEIPIIGMLFRSSDFQQDRTELIFIVTPRLVKPLAVAYKLPTDGLQDPTRIDLFVDGKLEGKAPPNKP